MKTSNKLLIILALIAFLVPVAFSFYQTQYYVTANWDKPEKKVSFKEEIPGFTKKKMPAFTSVQLNGKDVSFNVTIIKDAESGVRFSTRSKEKLTTEVVNGVLMVVGKKRDDARSQYIEIMVYAPDVQSISGKDIDALDLGGDQSNIHIFGTAMSSIELSEWSKFANVSIKADSVKEIKIYGAKIQTLSADLTGSSFSTDKVSYNSLDLSTVNGDVLLGEEETGNQSNTKEKKASIESLNLRTVGKGTISINMDIKHVTGSLSDSSKVSMPVSYLKQFTLPARAANQTKLSQSTK